MDSQSHHHLILAGKSSAEVELAKTLKSNNNIKLTGDATVYTYIYSEMGIPFSEESFHMESYMNSLSTKHFGRLLMWSPRLPSTHDIVSQNFGELPIGAVCLADVQYKGRGRSKNPWESPLGCLLFSFTIQMGEGRIVPLLQYVISLAITEAMNDLCDIEGFPHLDIKIKWPNDLYLNGLKVGGILCTSTYKSKKFNVSAGVGLNVDNKKPTTCLSEVLQQLTSVPYKLRREDILAAFFNNFEKLYDIFLNQGFESLKGLYYKTWLHSGQKVVIQEKSEDRLVENVVTIQGLSSSGYLLAVGEDCQMYELHPDGNSFDFFKGLVRRKLN